jgi:hypothetical protein
MKAESRLSRLIFFSPWPMLVFLLLPLLVILSVTLGLQVLPPGSTRLLIINNLCFALFAGMRLIRYLAVGTRNIRYGSSNCRPRNTYPLTQPKEEVRALLSASGYSFDTEGDYGEKRDLGYLGSIVLYCGLFILLSVGCWDNLRQFSGVLLDGMGPATNLNKLESYRGITKGPFATLPASLPRLQINSQYLPDATYPRGATDLSLISEDGKVRQLLLQPTEPISYGAYDISMAKLVFEPQIVIKRIDTKQPLFNSIVTLNPLVQKRGAYSFYGIFQGYNLAGGVYYQPEKSSLLVVLSRNDRKVVADMAFQVDQQVEQGEFIISCAKMGQWSEIHVVHRRHKGLLVLGGIITILGLVLRIAIRPQRVWLEEATEGCMIRSSTRETMNILKVNY